MTRIRKLLAVLAVLGICATASAKDEAVQWELGSRFSIPGIDVDADYVLPIGQLTVPYEVNASDLLNIVSKGYAVFGKARKNDYEISLDLNKAEMSQDDWISLMGLNLSGFLSLPLGAVQGDLDLEFSNIDLTLAKHLPEVSDRFYLRGGLYKIKANVDVGLNLFVAKLPVTFQEDWFLQYLGGEYRFPVNNRVEIRTILDWGINSDEYRRLSVGAHWNPADRWQWEGGYQYAYYDMDASDAMSRLDFKGKVDGFYGSITYRF